jgi:chaperonin GroES
MDIRPLHDRVVSKRDERQRNSAAGILIPDSAGEKPTEGRVIAPPNPICAARCS